MTHTANHDDRLTQALKRNDELEIRIAFLENTLDEFNTQLSTLNSEFALAKKAIQLLYKRLEQVQENLDSGKDYADDSPPPHY